MGYPNARYLVLLVAAQWACVDTGSSNADAGTGEGGGSDTCSKSTLPPRVRIVTPAQGAILSGSVQVEVDATGDCPVTSVEFYTDRAGIRTATSAPFSVTWDTTSLENGSYHLRAVATDSRWRRGETTIAVFVEQACVGGGGNCPPRVRVTHPADGAVVCGQTTLVATVTDDLEVPNLVSFSVGSTYIATAAAGPYIAGWDSTTVQDGAHAVTAIARDSYGVTEFHSVEVIVDNTRACPQVPTVVFACPPPDPQGLPVCANAIVELCADARDDGFASFVREVMYAVDGTLLAGSIPLAPKWEATWDTSGYAEGLHEVRAIATDNDNLTTETVMQFMVYRRPLTIAVSKPLDGSILTSTPVDFALDTNGTGCGLREVTYAASGGMRLTARKKPFDASWAPDSFPSGTHELRVTAIDRAGNTATATSRFVMNRPPKVSIVTPTEGRTVFGSLKVDLDVSDDSSQETRAEASIDGRPAGSFTPRTAMESWTWTWDTTQSAYGPHTLGVVVSDNESSAEAEVHVFVDQPIAVSCALPAPSSGVNVTVCDGHGCRSQQSGGVSGIAPVTATVTDDEPVTGVDFLLDGQLLATDTTAPFSYDWDTTSAAAGSHVFTCRARDAGEAQVDDTRSVVTGIQGPAATYETCGSCANTECVDTAFRPCAGADVCGHSDSSEARYLCLPRCETVACPAHTPEYACRTDAFWLGYGISVCAPCPGQQGLACNARCVDAARDLANCGACGHACAAGDECHAGRCGPPVDREWAAWPIPADAPDSSAYTTTPATVTDNITGLTWQRNVVNEYRSWTGAQSYCSGLNLAGQMGWTLPTVIELLSIVNYGSFPAMDAQVFPHSGGAFWSSSLHVAYPRDAWTVDADIGNIRHNTFDAWTRVRCVRR